jgi:anti-sigma B factor antagonist
MLKTLAYPQIAVISPKDSLNAANAIEFQSQLAAAIAKPDYAHVLVDLGQVQSLDSAGLMALVSGLRLSQTLGKRFSLCSVSPSTRIVFELTQLDRVFEIFDSATEVA